MLLAKPSPHVSPIQAAPRAPRTAATLRPLVARMRLTRRGDVVRAISKLPRG